MTPEMLYAPSKCKPCSSDVSPIQQPLLGETADDDDHHHDDDMPNCREVGKESFALKSVLVSRLSISSCSSATWSSKPSSGPPGNEKTRCPFPSSQSTVRHGPRETRNPGSHDVKSADQSTDLVYCEDAALVTSRIFGFKTNQLRATMKTVFAAPLIALTCTIHPLYSRLVITVDVACRKCELGHHCKESGFAWLDFASSSQDHLLVLFGRQCLSMTHAASSTHGPC